jgi:hypothetical protein
MKKILGIVTVALLLGFSISGETDSESNQLLSSDLLVSNIDIDGNEQFDALTDGLLILRSMFGLTGSSLIAGAIAGDAIYTQADDVEARIAGLSNRLDIDENGNVDALTDGLIILRYLFGLTGDTLIAGVVATDANRISVADIESYISKLTSLDTEPPIFTSSDSFAVAENQIAIGTTTATDANSALITFTISGVELSITSAGALSFVSAPDYEAKSSYTATVTATDGTNITTQDIVVMVTDVDEAPILGVLNYTAVENQTPIGSVVANDPEGQTVTFTVSGSELIITSGGVLTFASAPDYEAKSSYTATVTASDGINSTTGNITVNVTDIDDVAPAFTSPSAFSAAENQISIGEVTATDVDTSDSSITFTVSGSELIITSGGVLTFVSAPDYETTTSYTATVTATDGINSTIQSITVNVTDIDDVAPAFTSPSAFSAAENQISIGEVTATDVDTSDSSITFTVSGSELIITSGGVLTFVSAPDYETTTSYTATVTATDGINSTIQSITVNVTDIDDVAPVFTSPASFSAAENQISIGTITATDVDTSDSSISFTVSGSELIITSGGVLTFASAPDYETKTSYTATVTASDGTNTTTQNITVNVTDVNDPPAITSSATFNVPEPSKIIGTILGNDADEDDLVYSIAQNDDDSITINSSTGALNFNSPTDYETKNTYSITARVGDGSESVTQNITINISDVNEETEGPNWSEARITPNPTNVSSASVDATATVRIKDTTGVDQSKLPTPLLNPGGFTVQSIRANSRYQLVSGNAQDGIYAATFTVPYKQAGGYYYLSSGGYAYDVWGNGATNQEGDVDIDNGEEQDVPILTNSYFSPSSVDVSENSAVVTATINVQDASGINQDSLPRPYFQTSGFSGQALRADYSWQRTSGTVENGGYTASFTLPVGTAFGNYIFQSGTFYDVWGRGANNQNNNHLSVSITPIFTSSPTFSAPENQTLIGSAEAAHPQGYTITYSISGTDSSSLSIDSSSGSLTFKSPPDYETKSSYTAILTATSTDPNTNSTQSATQHITVNIIDTNDAAIFTSTNIFMAAENQYEIGIVTVTDIDSQDFDFKVSGSEIEVTSSGILSFVSAPDYEVKDSYVATVTVSDSIDTSTQDITVNISNVDDVAPVFSSSSTLTAAENQIAIGTVTATDIDTDNSNLTFSVSGSDLSITPTGVLTFTPSPDYEAKTSYAATVTATDGINSTTQDITVNVTNINDVAPEFWGLGSFTIDENETYVGTFIAYDADSEDSDITYSISGSDLILASERTLNFAIAPDYETKSIYTASLTASDGINTTTEVITVNVRDINDFVPVFTSPPIFSVEENRSDIGTVTATDLDSDNFGFTVSGTELRISSPGGKLQFKSRPDYEEKSVYKATVTTVDGPNSSTQDIVVNVLDVDDVAPVFTSSETFNASENQKSIGTVTVVDVDSESTSFTITGNDIDISADGVLSFVSVPDYEKKSSYSARVTASDGTNSDWQFIDVNVIDENDEAPTITSSPLFTASENQTEIGNIIATDSAGDSLSYTVSGSDLLIDADGLLSFKAAPDYETKASYSAEIAVSDGLNATAQTISIKVLDADDTPPSFTSAETFSAAENQLAIGYVTVSDIDTSDGSIDFSISGSELLISSSGVLTFVGAPDFEIKKVYTAVVTATDGTNSATQNIVVNVTDVDDVAPEFTSASNFSAMENQTSIGTVYAIDKDSEAITFTIFNWVSPGQLAITSDGILSFVSPLDYETDDITYSAIVTASDGSNKTEQGITVSLMNSDDVAPTITSPSSFIVPENQNNVGTVVATDVDSEDIIFSVSGDDLSINGSGLLTFKVSPDYEAKSSYSVSVTATDGTNSSSQTIAISITNVNDVAPIFGSTEFIALEGQTDVGLVVVADPENDVISLSLSGGDANAFVVNSSSKELSFKEAPIFDIKSSYETTIRASDGINSSSKQLKVTIDPISTLPDHPQAIFGTEDDDDLTGGDREYDIIIGAGGDDILTGGSSNRSGAPYFIDIFQFTDNSGNDVITDFFIQEVFEASGGYSRLPTDGRYNSDRLEITRNINGQDVSTATQILTNSSNNSNNDAVINLGSGNTITILGHPLENIKPQHIHIIPRKAKLEQGSTVKGLERGTSRDDVLRALSLNSRLEGSDDPFKSSQDGYDILIGGVGDDVLIGGTNDHSTGGFVIDLYKFNSNSGDDLVIGYFDMDFDRGFSSITTRNPQGSGARSDKLIIPVDVNGTNTDSFADILSRSGNNSDGWAKLDLGADNSIIVHGVPIEKLKPDSFIFTFSDDYTEIFGDDDNNILEGTSGNDWIDGSERILPRFGEGVDYLFPGAGDDILISGTINHGANVYGETFYKTNFFINKSGAKTIVGLSGRGSEYFNPSTKSMLDTVFIERSNGMRYLSDIPISYDDDGFLQLNLNSNSTVKFHGLEVGEIDVNNLVLHDAIDNYIYGTKNSDNLLGTSGNDYIDGWTEYHVDMLCVGMKSQHDILNGQEGNDVLVGGISAHFCGGFNRDLFIFGENSGQDIILDFTSNFELPGKINEYRHMDVLEIQENINGLSFRTAQEIIDISSDNIDGFAELQLGGSSTVTLHGKSLSTISPMHFRITPKIDSYIVGTDGNDALVGDDLNNYIKGSTDTLRRTADGYDILDGGAGDDVLDGGVSVYAAPGYDINIYRFDKNYGDDKIFGFFAADIYEEYSGIGTPKLEAGIQSDKIEIPNDVVLSASTLITSANSNYDGWAELSFEGTTITLHMIPVSQLKNDYFHIIPRTSKTLVGTVGNDILVGGEANERLLGSDDPYDYSADGSDLLVGGGGDDILNGGGANGYTRDRYRFNNNFGNDYLISFFAEDLCRTSCGTVNVEGEGALESDRLEFNESLAASATDIINSAENNPDGWAKISLGGNSLTIFGVSKESLKPDYFHIIPNIENTISGTKSFWGSDDDVLIGSTGNDYIEGSLDALGRTEDGADSLEGLEGDDVLIGGPNRGAGGGWVADRYIFGDDSGDDLVIGFLFDGTGTPGEHNDILQIKPNINDSGIDSFEEVLANTADNIDGWAVISLGSNNSITLHGVQKTDLLKRNFQFFN